MQSKPKDLSVSFAGASRQIANFAADFALPYFFHHASSPLRAINLRSPQLGHFNACVSTGQTPIQTCPQEEQVTFPWQCGR